MRCIIAGGREIDDPAVLVAALDACPFSDQITTVLEGGAFGVDSLARRFAYSRDLPCETHEADWKKYGKSAGPRRNRFMASIADALIAIPGAGRGTLNMVEEAIKVGLPVFVYDVHLGQARSVEERAARLSKSAGRAALPGAKTP